MTNLGAEETQELEPLRDTQVFDLEDQSSNDEPTPPRRRRWPWIVAVVAAVFVLFAGVLFGVQMSNQRALTAATDAHRVAASELTTASSGLTDATEDGQAVHDESAGQVADDAIRRSLAQALDATTALTSQASSVPRSGVFESAGEARTATQDVDLLTHRVTAQSRSLREATAAVSVAHEEWRLAQATAALDTASGKLTASIRAGEAAFLGSEGRVSDNGLRQALRATLDKASTTSKQAIERADITAVQAATKSMVDATTAVEGSARAVSDAQTTWQAQQSPRTQAQTERGTGGTPKSGSGGSRTGTGSNGTGSGRTGSSGSSGGAKSGGSTSGGGWTTHEGWGDGGGVGVCGDTAGNSWAC